MTPRDEPFFKLVERRLAELRKGAGVVEREAGLTADTIRNVLRAKSRAGPQLATAREICDALGFEFCLGPRREEVYRGFHEAAVEAFRAAGAPEAVTDVFRQRYLPIPCTISRARTRKDTPPPLAVSLAWRHGACGAFFDRA